MARAKAKTKRVKRFLVWGLAGKHGRSRTLGRFDSYAEAQAFARAHSITRETLAYVDEKQAHGWEPITTYSSGMRIKV
jgi:hypothetical protein